MINPRVLLATGLTLLACVPASAQFRPERPYRGIFASGIDAVGQSLTAQATLSGGYDDNILAAAANQSSIRTGQEGSFGQFSGGLNYSLNAGPGTVNASAGTSQRYYPSLQNEYLQNYNASLGGTLRVTAKPLITLNQSVSYRPYTFLDVFPGAVATEPIVGASEVPEPDYVPISSQYFSYAGGINLSQQLTQRTTFSSNWNYQATDRQSNQFWRQTANADVSVGMTKDLSLRLGYSYTQAHYDDRVTEVHRPDIGLDFLRALSLTRRTSLTFGVGTQVMVYQGRTRFQAVGNANVTHEIGRSWTAGASYNRGTYFVDTLSEPVTGDSASAQVFGLITRRIQLQGVISASLGQMGFATSQDFDSYRSSLSLSTAITRWMNAGLSYVYYRYSFDEQVELEPGVPHNVNRQSVSAQVSFWAPIFNRTRRPNAAR